MSWNCYKCIKKVWVGFHSAALNEEFDVLPVSLFSPFKRGLILARQTRGQLLLFTLDAERQTTYPVVEDVRRGTLVLLVFCFQFRGYEWIWFMIYNFIDHLYFHVSFLPTQTPHKSNTTLWSDFLCLAGCFFNHHLQGSPTKSANFREFTIWDSSWCQEFLRWWWLGLRASTGPSPWCLHRRCAEKICWKRNFEELTKRE